jgi:hypothetical protein
MRAWTPSSRAKPRKGWKRSLEAFRLRLVAGALALTTLTLCRRFHFGNYPNSLKSMAPLGNTIP